jgi:hypothetical protein
MTEPKHTPGPWQSHRVGTVSAGQYLIMIKPVRGGAVQKAAEQERLANARLIAAAPEMLAILQELAESAVYWSEYDVPLGIVDRINDAIRKATT